MPKYEFYCSDCSLLFDKIFDTFPKDLNSLKAPCSKCKKESKRYYKPQQVGVSYKNGTPTPTVDQIVGSDSDKRWTKIEERQQKVKKAREKYGTTAMEIGAEGFTPVGKERIEERKQAHDLLDRGFKKDPSVKLI